jgi:hypothetical protein
VDDQAARKVERPVLVQPAAGEENPVRERAPNGQVPNRRKEAKIIKLHLADDSAGDDRRGDDGEHELEH